MTRPLAWILLALVAVGATAVAVRLFPQAFSIVALDITMDRAQALAAAREVAAREHLGPRDFDQAASFGLDEEVQTFVELEGGGKDAFTRMLRDRLYAAYTWRVRHFHENETNEVTIRFTPDGSPYGFVERVREDAPGAALDPAAARRIAEAGAARWHVDLTRFALVEQGQERRPAGRIDHTFTWERPAPTLGEGRYRLRVVVAGDRLIEITHSVRVPEAFTRRYANMRAANTAIGIGSAVGVGVLYFGGGIGVGLFFMLRRRYLLWHHAAAWGVIVALLQVLAALNELPLAWMSYDTALSRRAFLGQQLAMLGAVFVGSAVLFALSFMAAETLTRRAFGSHPQLWRVWARGPGSSTAVLGRTIGGLLLVAVFFAYDVLLYAVTTRALGWWAPSEALFHPDVLASYAPWLSAVANSFQAGFWEEALFRAVPLSCAALIGDRFGKRRLFLALGFVVQALVFGAGHAPYPNQPAYARPVELILPSIGFGLLYVYYGLLPGIILHFAFDVVWFALPIFVAVAPGIRFQQAMVILVTLVPLWIVLYRRLQAGRWSALAPEDRNAAWVPPPAPPPPELEAPRVAEALPARTRSAWLALGAIGMIACAVLVARTPPGPTIEISREQAATLARRAVETQGVTLGPEWRVMPVPEDGDRRAQAFVAETAGEARRAALAATYLPNAFWRVRIARFEGDLAERAEEWSVFLAGDGSLRSTQHVLPEGRPGASLDEAAARALAVSALKDRFHLDVARGQAREVSAEPDRLKARTDWTFTFVDNTVAKLPVGEPRVRVQVAGDAVAATGRFVFIPEQWQRAQRAPSTRNTILQMLVAIVFGGILGTAAVSAVIAWSRHRYAPGLFVSAALVALVAAVAERANGWPLIVSAMPTEAPLPLLLAMAIVTGLVALGVSATVTGLVIGWLPAHLAPETSLPRRDAARLGIAVGAFAAAATLLAQWLTTPAWARGPDLSAAGAVLPLVQIAVSPIDSLLVRVAIVLAALTGLDRYTAGWSRHRGPGIALLAALGFLASGAPVGGPLGWWVAGSLITAAVFAAVVLTVVRYDLTMVPIILGTMAAIGALSRGAARPFPGAGLGAAFAATLVGLTAWWLFVALRDRRGGPVPTWSSSSSPSATSGGDAAANHP